MIRSLYLHICGILLTLKVSNGQRQLKNESAEKEDLQPKVTVVDQHPATMLLGSISDPLGTPWCEGRPTVWFVGHERNDSAYCLEDDGSWQRTATCAFEWDDPRPWRQNLDRHDCVSMDVNADGITDIICLIGAEKGYGEGFNEIYLTQEDGTLSKVSDGHGLQKYTSMRTRHINKLKGPDASKMVFIGTNGRPREDGKPNQSRMFRLEYDPEQGVNQTYFSEVDGPWTEINYYASCIVPVDLSGNGVDDLIVCNQRGNAYIYLQDTKGEWSMINVPNEFGLKSNRTGWENARVADVTGDGVKDLLIAHHDFSSQRFYFKVYRGINRSPFFDFSSTWFKIRLPNLASDLAVLDVNNDGYPDVYLPMMDRSTDTSYCVGSPDRLWGGGPNPPKEWVPPVDLAQDMLLIGQPGDPPFYKIMM